MGKSSVSFFCDEIEQFLIGQTEDFIRALKGRQQLLAGGGPYVTKGILSCHKSAAFKVDAVSGRVLHYSHEFGDAGWSGGTGCPVSLLWR